MDREKKDWGKVILASASPRRTELLTQVGILHQVIPSDCEEIITKTVPHEIVMELAREKAENVFEKYMEYTQNIFSKGFENFIIIGADTIVAIGDTILGKPQDEAEAFHMLKKLQGGSHQVYTGVSMIRMQKGKKTVSTFYECSQVHFYPISDTEMQAYIATGEPTDKAGSYGIQGRFAKYVKGIEGDYNNIVGLPVGRIYQKLKNM